VSVGSDNPVILDYREKKNDQWIFFGFLKYCCSRGYILEGDLIILDNVALHLGNDSLMAMHCLTVFCGFTLIFTPVYSPELNPCELVFSEMKKYIRNHRTFAPLKQLTIKALSTINQNLVSQFFFHCIYPPTILPEIKIDERTKKKLQISIIIINIFTQTIGWMKIQKGDTLKDGFFPGTIARKGTIVPSCLPVYLYTRVSLGVHICDRAFVNSTVYLL